MKRLAPEMQRRQRGGGVRRSIKTVIDSLPPSQAGRISKGHKWARPLEAVESRPAYFFELSTSCTARETTERQNGRGFGKALRQSVNMRLRRPKKIF